MLITKQGEVSAFYDGKKPWWIGQQVKCLFCGAEGILGPADADKVRFQKSDKNQISILIPCETESCSLGALTSYMIGSVDSEEIKI